MPSDAETVADVLRDLDQDSEVGKLMAVADGQANPEILDYEDWVRPMKLTGGRVCLRVKGPGWRIPVFYQWHPDGLELRDRSDLLAKGPEAGRLLRIDLDTIPSHITPVLREDTPFGGDEDG